MLPLSYQRVRLFGDHFLLPSSACPAATNLCLTPQADLGVSPSPHQGAQCSWATGSLLTPGASDSGQTLAGQAIVSSVGPCLACGPPHRGDPRTAAGLPRAGDPSATICHYLQQAHPTGGLGLCSSLCFTCSSFYLDSLHLSSSESPEHRPRHQSVER